jgi:acyl carrier protein
MTIDANDLANIFSEACNLPAGAVSPTTRLSELQDWDSLSVLSLITDVDVRYNVVLDPSALMACTTVTAVAKLVESTLAGNPNSAAA